MSRLRLALVALLAVLVVAAPAGARSKHSANTWHLFHIHANAYGGSGSCTHDWHATRGECTGLMEAGSFLGHNYPHSFKVFWSWEGEKVYVSLHDPTWYPLQYMHATKPHNWFTLTVSSAYLVPATTEHKLYLSGSSAAAGHPDGPLFVNLSSHSNPTHIGYSLDLKGYLRLK